MKAQTELSIREVLISAGLALTYFAFFLPVEAHFGLPYWLSIVLWFALVLSVVLRLERRSG